MSTIPTEKLDEKLTTLIHKDELTKESKKTHPVMYVIPILFFSWIGWISYNNYIDNSIEEKVNNTLYKNPSLTMYRLNSSVDNKVLTLKGVVPSKELKELAQKNMHNIKNIEEIKNQVIVIEQKEKVIIKEKKSSFLVERIEFLLTALNVDEDIDISYVLNDKKELILNGKVISTKRKEYIFKQFENIKEISFIKNMIIIIPPFLDSIIYFDLSSSQIKLEEEYKLIKLINLLSKTDSDFILKVIVSNDRLGSDKINQKLNMKRLINVEKYLKVQGHILQKIVLEEKNKNSNKDIKFRHDRYIMFSLENRNK
jgi:outer membrane protein OmpA-like peptidoglycan-associated protein